MFTGNGFHSSSLSHGSSTTSFGPTLWSWTSFTLPKCRKLHCSHFLLSLVILSYKFHTLAPHKAATMPFDGDGFYYHDTVKLPTILEEEEDNGDYESAPQLPEPEAPQATEAEDDVQEPLATEMASDIDLPNAVAAQAAMQPLFAPVGGRRRVNWWPLTRSKHGLDSPSKAPRRRSMGSLWRKMFRSSSF
jgi:hypothetical protein